METKEKCALVRAFFFVFWMLLLPVHAGVIVVQGVSPGAISWPGSPLISTMANPSSATSAQTFKTGRTTLGQTFSIAGTNYILQQIDIYAGGGTGTVSLSLRLFDLGFQTAPDPNPYGSATPNETISGNLFNSGSGFSVAYSNQVNGVLEFDLTGSDQILLQNGHMYVFELGGVSGSNPINWFSRNSGNPYSGGAAYTNRNWLNGSSACDFSMAIYATATTNNLSAPIPQIATGSVDWNDVHQRIDGFGASSAWDGTWTTSQADMFFSTNVGIGLSLLRTRIAPGGTTIENSIMQMARDRGAKVWSTPWSPATQFKSNGNLNGGSFLGNAANYQAYAGQLANYVVNMQTQYGVNLYAISIQNEPDADVTSYESCNWTGQQIHDFVPYLYAALVASNVASTKIILPESQNWSDYQNLAGTAMSDANVAADVGIIADHNYDGATGPTTLGKNSYGKSLWETEVSVLFGSESSIYNGVYWAGRIHAFMTQAQVNAWHHWWLIAGSGNAPNEGLLDSAGNPTKRMYVLGQFSRFVRPNYYRIGENNIGPAQISAYKDPNSGNFAIVAINANSTTPVNLTLTLTNFSATSVTPWITSATMSLSNQPPVAVVDSSFTYTLPGPSVVTFVGQGNATPILAPIADYTDNVGVPLLITNVATDSDLPAQILTFSPANTFPASATLDSSSGIFSWRPMVSQANTTNTIQVQVTDNGVPNLSATNSFNVIVNPLTNPMVSSISLSGGQANLAVNGPTGPDYTLLTTTNLANGWQTLFTTNSPVTPFMFVDTNSTGAARFYRLQIGP
jgi:glucuronoarabinoxylan endo-1,4-beta-xylanase